MLLFVKRLFISSRCHSKWKIFGGWYPNAFLKYISTDQEKGISQHTICWRYSYFSYYFISKLKLGICHFHVWSSIFRDLAFSVDILIEVKRCKYMPNEPINNYWMRLSISWIIKTEVCVICRSWRLRQITQTRGFDHSWYHAKTEFSNCFIIHFSHNSSSETEAKRSAILFLRRTVQGA